MFHRPHATPSAPALESLSRREREIVHAIFALGNRASSEEIRARLTNPPTESAVRIMLARLERKGHVRHQQEGLRFLYSATLPESVARKTLLRQYLDTFFGGSAKQLMASLLAEGSWDPDDLRTLRAEINRRYAETRRQKS